MALGTFHKGKQVLEMLKSKVKRNYGQSPVSNKIKDTLQLCIFSAITRTYHIYI